MKQTKIIMGMPITVELVGKQDRSALSPVFNYFKEVDERFSPYKPTSELAKVNDGLAKTLWSEPMHEVMKLCEQTKQLSGGFFDIKRADGTLDPSGLVKGWAIDNAAKLLKSAGYSDFYIEAGGDIQTAGLNEHHEAWAVGIRSPFELNQIVKTIKLNRQAIATSGTYIRGEHIYDPVNNFAAPAQLVSLSVIGPNIFEADRFATAAYAMGERGINFIASLPGFEAYQINQAGQATFTKGFNRYVA